MDDDPISRFNRLWTLAKSEGQLKQRNSVCVSTLDADGYPSARFVDLKAADAQGFVFCTHLDSDKALDIQRDARTGLTLWWEHVAMQVRIVGSSAPIADDEADAHWAGRLRDAQIATATFQQSRPLASPEALVQDYAQAVERHAGQPILRPANWGGFRLALRRIEFLEFKATRLHVRTAYELRDGRWETRFLQP